MSYFNFNGKICAAGSLVAGPENRGLRYGDGLFETIKMKDGRLLFPDYHFSRLWKGMKVLQFDIPKHFTPEGLEEQMKALAQKNGHNALVRIRLAIFRGDGGLYDAVNHLPNYTIQTWNLSMDSGSLNSNGLILGIYPDAQKNCDLFSNLKHNNYLPYIMGALQAKKEKWNDAIILNNAGRICDTTIANIFIIKEGNIYTPALTEGCVAGVMRKLLLENLGTAGFDYKETAITITDCLAADEVFLTNSIRNIQWVQRIGEKVYENTITTKIYKALLPTIFN